MTDLFTYTNPSAVNRIGDPYVLKAPDGYYYCYPTSRTKGFKVWKSKDLCEWEDAGLAYDGNQEGCWADSKFWAPEVVFCNNKYYMYYTGCWAEKKSLRIGLAISDTPAGPFAEALGRPLFDFSYAAIDAHVFIDTDGQKYLYYSRDCSENIVNEIHESHIYGVKLADTMRELAGEPVLLTKPEQEWEKRSGSEFRWNEGPFMIKRDETYYLMFSANCFAGKFYALGYGVSKNPLGPFEKYKDNPILEAPEEWRHVSGPGHHSLTPSPDGKELFAVYHTHVDVQQGGGSRQMAIDRAGFRDDGSMYINGPSLSPMPKPSGSGPYKNIAGTAVIEASSGRDRVKYLKDGEIGFYERFSRYDWVSDPEDREPAITLTWEKPEKICSLMVYKSGLYTAAPFELLVSFDNEKETRKISFPPLPGSAAILTLENKTVSSCSIKIKPLDSGLKEYRLSEILILGE
jgi:GH43 family beta-xylosidase